MIKAYPLYFPNDYIRNLKPIKSKFDTSLADARDGLIYELQRMGIKTKDIVISSNVKVRLDGLPYSTYSGIKDHGVAVYFKYQDQTRVFCCDKYNRVECNLQAIRKTVEALRGLDRWGVSAMMERTLIGFNSLVEEN